MKRVTASMAERQLDLILSTCVLARSVERPRSNDRKWSLRNQPVTTLPVFTTTTHHKPTYPIQCIRVMSKTYTVLTGGHESRTSKLKD